MTSAQNAGTGRRRRSAIGKKIAAATTSRVGSSTRAAGKLRAVASSPVSATSAPTA